MKNLKAMAFALVAALSFTSPAHAQDTAPSNVATVVAEHAVAKAVEATKIDCGNLDIKKYTDQQIADLRRICDSEGATKLAEEQKVTPDDVRQWASLGKEFGQAVTETAKGLGVAVNEFLFTPVGFMLAFYFMWDMIGGILIGIPLLIGIWCLYVFICNKINRSRVEYAFVPVLWGLFSIRRIASVDSGSDHDTRAATWVLMGIPAVILSLIDIAAVIF